MIEKPTRINRVRSLQRTIALSAAVLLATAALLVPSGPAVAEREPGAAGASLDIALTPAASEVVGSRCAHAIVELAITNITEAPIFGHVVLQASGPMQLSRSSVAGYLPPGYTQRALFTVRAPLDAAPGTYAIRARGEGATAGTSVTVADADDQSNVALRAEASASTTDANYPVCGGIDSDRDPDHWNQFTGWRDATKGDFPDWYQLTFDHPETIGAVEIVTLSGDAALSDWDLEAMVDGDWVMIASVRHNEDTVARSEFEPVETTEVRLVITGARDGAYSRLLELEVYAPAVS